MERIILTIIYLITVPIVITVISWKILQESRYLDYMRDVERTHADRKKDEMFSVIKKMNKFGTVFLVVMLISLPIWNVSSAFIMDMHMHGERVDVPGAAYPPLLDPVDDKIGPTFDVDYVIERMEESPRRWLPSEVNRHVDIEKMTRLPGILAVYRFTRDRYLITYTYIAPFPITETYGFRVRDPIEEHIFSLERDDYEGYIEEGFVSEELIDAFQEEGYDIKEGAEIVREAGNWWIIENGRREYMIEIDDDQLNIYNQVDYTLLSPEHNILIYPNFALRPDDLM